MKQGYPHWNNHPAKQHLEDDVYNGIADTMIPSQLRMTRRSYQDFPPDIFCIRMHAKKRKQREQTFLGCQEKQNFDETAFKRSSGDKKEQRVGKGVGGGAFSFPTVNLIHN
jgi:hypothetical protein